jgi:ubiquitin-conjugating enzyme E2 Z
MRHSSCQPESHSAVVCYQDWQRFDSCRPIHPPTNPDFVDSLEYPSKAPNVTHITTDGGRCRFNPNIYANGKVCLSILGTWHGENGEQWSSAQGLESILLSIQSLMSPNPFENEPGFESAQDDRAKKLQKAYVQKIQHETIRVSIIQRLEGYLGLSPADPISAPDLVSPEETTNPDDIDESNVPFEPFKDLCKRRFLWYYESYLAACQQGLDETKDQQPFVRMPFEAAGNNSIDGKFCWHQLRQRLHRIKAALDAETEKWASQGLEAVRSEARAAANLQHQFQQLTGYFQRSELPHSIVLEDNNPFVWVMTYFGSPMTNLDGGLFRIRMSFSPRFPDEQPRVRFETKLFHYHISPDGTACYTPDPMRTEDVRVHLEAVLATLEEEDPAYDPRKTVNPEASKLYWGNNAQQRKTYSRKLRRTVQDSLEDPR